MHSACKDKKNIFNLEFLAPNTFEIPSSFNLDYLFSSKAYLEAIIHVSPHIQHQIILIKKEELAIGYLYFQIMPFKGNELKSYIPQGEECLINKSLEALVDLALERVNWNLAVLGNVFITGDNGQYFKEKISEQSKWEIIQQSCKALTKNRKVDAFLISDLTEVDLEGDELMLQKSYRLFEVEPDLILDIQESWINFDDYLDCILSKYRVRTKKVLSKSEALIIKDLSAEEILLAENEIFKLYKNVVDAASFKLAEINHNYFYEFKKAFPELFQLRAFYLGNQMLGFISYFVGNKALHINFVGLDYSLNKEHCIYQRILYDCIEQGILLKMKTIHFGRTASEIKTSVGAYPRKTYSLLKHNSRIPNIAIRPLTTYLKPEPFEIRKPFKSQVAS